MIQALFVILGIRITLTWLTKLDCAVHCTYQWLVHGKRRALFPTYLVMKYVFMKDNYWTRIQEFSFPFLYMCRSICSQLWISCCTVSHFRNFSDFWTIAKLVQTVFKTATVRQKLPKPNSIERLFGSAPEEKLLWTSINLPRLTYAKIIQLETFRILLICLTSQLDA